MCMDIQSVRPHVCLSAIKLCVMDGRIGFEIQLAVLSKATKWFALPSLSQRAPPGGRLQRLQKMSRWTMFTEHQGQHQNARQLMCCCRKQITKVQKNNFILNILRRNSNKSLPPKITNLCCCWICEYDWLARHSVAERNAVLNNRDSHFPNIKQWMYSSGFHDYECTQHNKISQITHRPTPLKIIFKSFSRRKNKVTNNVCSGCNGNNLIFKTATWKRKII